MDLKDFKEGCYASHWKKIITDLICVLQRILTIDMHAKALIFESVCKKDLDMQLGKCALFSHEENVG